MDVQTVSVVLAAIGVLIAAVNQIYTSRQATEQRQRELETRQAQLFMQVYDRWTAKDMTTAYGLARYTYAWETFDEAWHKYGADVDIDAYSNFQILHNYYEGLGVLVKRNLIDIGLVEDLFSQRVLWHWEHHKPLFLEARKITRDPTQYDGIEYLYNLMKQRQ